MHSVHRGTRKSPSCSSEPCAHSIQNAQYPLPVYTLIFFIRFFFCTLALCGLRSKAYLRFWFSERRSWILSKKLSPISDNQMDKSMFCCPPKQIRIKGLDFFPQNSLSSRRQLSCVFFHKSNFCLQIGKEGHPPNLLRSQIH